jgi:predicted transcriptional regulator
MHHRRRHSRKEGAAEIICAPILTSVFERIVDVPVAIMKPKATTVLDALDVIGQGI